MSPITKEFTKERVAEIIHAAGLEPCDYEEVFGSIKTGEIVAMARIALASLEAEPVAWLLSGGGAKNNVSFDSGNAYADPLREVTPLYTAPPAPVSVPAAMEMDDDFDSAFEHGKAVGWNTYRAAMLQGAEPVTTAGKLPFEQWLSQQTGTIDVECGCVMTEVFFHWLRVAYEAGNYPVIPDGWVLVPEEPTHEMLEAGDEQFGTYDVYRRMIAASPQQEVK
ncbi:hypothetical protein HV124_15790 [Enterobacter asburiae]|uniref:hypothetical protein n=1 Tax=Enterobacter asburiae TaxID=61645 RepID=UPI0015F8F36A|nr:hypothetical protein [Enterobacter asburiae]MBA7987442.1 hypothetical protein [Enterobacter asburiae]